MRKKLLLSLLVVSILTLFPVMDVVGRKTAPHLTGTMDLQFNLGWPGPQEDVPDWVGTITIGNDEYGMAFFCTGSGKSFDDVFKGKVHFFEETWVIYKQLTFEFDEDGFLSVFIPGSVLLSGYDKGQTNIQNSNYHMTGYVEDASEEVSMWLGRNVYMSGIIVWYPNANPQYAPGIFRIN